MARLCHELGTRLGELKKQYIGRNGVDGDTPKEFIPRSVLERELTPQKIDAILTAGNQAPLQQATVIAEHFLRVFALLVYIDKVAHLDDFIENNLRDHSFPLDETRPALPDNYVSRKLLKAVYESQWIFFPVTFDQTGLYHQTISPHHILPISHETVIKKGNAVTVSKIETSQECTAFDHVSRMVKTWTHLTESSHSSRQPLFENATRSHRKPTMREN